MRIALITLFSLSLYASLCAQEQSTLQYIESTDGYVYRGWYIEHDDESVWFETEGGDTVTFKINEVVQWINPDDFFIYPKGKYHMKSGKFSIIDFYMGGDVNGFVMQFNYTHGKRISPKAQAGGGIGFNFLGDNVDLADQEFFAELYGYFKYYITNSKLRPFVDLKLGAFTPVDVNLFRELTPGPILQGGLGIEFAQATVTRFSLKMSFLTVHALQKVREGSRTFDDLSVYTTLFGLSFNF